MGQNCTSASLLQPYLNIPPQNPHPATQSSFVARLLQGNSHVWTHEFGTLKFPHAQRLYFNPPILARHLARTQFKIRHHKTLREAKSISPRLRQNPFQSTSKTPMTASKILHQNQQCCIDAGMVTKTGLSHPRQPLPSCRSERILYTLQPPLDVKLPQFTRIRHAPRHPYTFLVLLNWSFLSHSKGIADIWVRQLDP